MMTTLSDEFVLISGRSNEPLAIAIASHLGLPLTPILLDSFSSGETRVEILQSVRNKRVYFIQSAYTYVSDSPSPNDYIMETVLVVDACFRASAKDIVLVMPSLPYTEEPETTFCPINPEEIVCQTDFQRYMKTEIFPSCKESSPPDDPELLQGIKSHQERFSTDPNRKFVTPHFHPSPFKLMAKLIESSANGVRQLVTVALPRPQLVGYFDIPVDDLPIAPVLQKSLPSDLTAIAVSDISLAKQASQITNALIKPFILMQLLPRNQEFDLAGDENITRDSHILFIDNFCDRVFQAAQQLKNLHNCKVSLLIIHLFLPNPDSDLKKLELDTVFDSIFLTNSVRIPDFLTKIEKIKVIDHSVYLGESIKFIQKGISLKSINL